MFSLDIISKSGLLIFSHNFVADWCKDTFDSFNSFDADRTQVLERAWESGLVRILVPGINLASSKAALRQAESDGRVYAAVGVHPNDALRCEEDTLDPGAQRVPLSQEGREGVCLLGHGAGEAGQTEHARGSAQASIRRVCFPFGGFIA